MAKLMAPNVRIDWFPEGHFVDPFNPSTAELNEGFNLSPAILTGYTLGFTDPDTEDVSTIFDDFEKQEVLADNYEANLRFFLMDRDSFSLNEIAYFIAENIFHNSEHNVGYFTIRVGFKWDEPYALTEPRQKIDIFKIVPDLAKVVTEDDSGPILLDVKFLPLGEAAAAVEIGQTLYKWLGAPFASPSVKIIDGVEVARNYVPGYLGWVAGNTSVTRTESHIQLSGGYADARDIYIVPEGVTSVQLYADVKSTVVPSGYDQGRVFLGIGINGSIAGVGRLFPNDDNWHTVSQSRNVVAGDVITFRVSNAGTAYSSNVQATKVQLGINNVSPGEYFDGSTT